MAIIKCKMCGGDLILSSDSTVAECEYCGTVQTIPTVDNEKKLTLFARANRLRMACEFDKAAGVYEAIVADFPEEAEAYWGLVLCKYGIEYVDDPASGKKVPTCHRSSFDSVMDDANFEQALENADVIARKVYREEAKQIEEIRKGIIEVSSKEDPYDIFICYKETDINGNRTLDSVLAQDIYTALTEKGYRVFFSRITLEDKLGQEYEPYIFAALNSAKVMLAVGTDYEHYNAVWVKNEWSRFLHLISAGQKKTLIPCYKNIDAYDMPKEFAKLQAQDLGKIGAMQDLLRGIEKIIGNVEPHKANEYAFAQPFFPNNNSALLKRGFMALEDSEWLRANEFFEKALDQDAECGEAYFGLFLTENKLRNSAEFTHSRLAKTQTSWQENLEACEPSREIDEIVNAYLIPGYFEAEAIRKLFDFSRTYISCVKGRKSQLEKEFEFFKANKNLIRAGQYAKGDFSVCFKQIQHDIFSKMKERIAEAEQDAESQKKEVQQKYENHIDAAKKKAKSDFEKFSQWREKDYQEVLNQYYRVETSSDFRSLVTKFEGFKGYRESRQLAANCREKADELEQKERHDAIIKRAAEERRLAAEKAEAERLRKEKDAQERAVRLAEEKNRIKEEKKKRVQKLVCVILSLLIATAVTIYIAIIQPAQQYSRASELFNTEKYEEAVNIFESLNDYKDAAEQLQRSKFYWAEQLFTKKNYYQARSLWESLNGYNGAQKYVDECNIAIASQLIEDGKIAEAAILLGSVSTNNSARRQCLSLWEKIVSPTYIDAGYYNVVGLTEDGKIITSDSKSLPAWNAWNNIISVFNTSEGVVALNSMHTLYTTFGQHCEYDVSDWRNIVDIKAEGQFIIGLKSDGTVLATVDYYTDDYDWVYGVNEWKNIISIAASANHILGLKVDGSVVSVGNHYAKEQCEVSGWRDVVAIAAGYEHSVALKSDGTVVAVGEDGPVGLFSGVQHNDGRLETNSWTNIAKVFAGDGFTLALKSDGTVVATGKSMYGHCDVSNWSDIVDIVIDSYGTIGIKSDGSVVTTEKTDVSDWNNLMVHRQ